ncbi:winged helix DNA-binding domain-containing protein [Amycolatopsis anabasis]|uniref:winged helix DNA-binding domain-containing protein n=1 Tax=Amycolatopsis anabasis TaxID=1840409 RepID=UPI00131B6CA4|nr:winged helix DNA-binding domain-containing protein [Amycolatopsis anabasis]
MVTVDEAVRFRLAGHGLAERGDDLLAAAGAIGVQHTPPGSAGQALHARVRDLSPDVVKKALHEDKSLIQVWSVRGAPHVVPTADAAVFTTGLKPCDEESTLHFIRGAAEHLDALGLTASEAVERTLEALPEVLDGRELTKDELGVALADQVRVRKPGKWNEPDGLGKNTYGQSLVRFALYVAGLHGTVCFVSENPARFALTEQWLGKPLPPKEEPRAELVRRYLRCHGPSTPGEFAEWSGVSPRFARESWELVDPAEVRYRDRTAWTLAGDRPEPPRAKGIRLLPPYDPYLATRDRESLVADRQLRERVWRIVGNPGVVLRDGEIAGLWRPRKQGKRLTLTVEAFGELDANELVGEAESLAPFRGASEVRVQTQ